MPSFAQVFSSVPQLSALSEDDQQRLLSNVYDKIKGQEGVSEDTLRKFRDARIQTLYDQDVAAGKVPEGASRQDWQLAVGENYPTMPIRPEDREWADKRQKSLQALTRGTFKEDLRALAKGLAEPSHWPRGLAKQGHDLLGLLGDIGSPAAAAVHNILNPDAKISAAQLRRSTPESKAAEQGITKWYEESIKDDPSLYRALDAAMFDATIGAAFGAARLGKTAAQAAQAGAPLTGMSKARQLFAPIVSNVTGGQVIYHGFEALDDAIDDLDLSDSQKTGLRVGALVAGGLLSGMTLENYIEKAVAGPSTSKLAAAGRIGDSANRVRVGGATFEEDLANNPYLSDDYKELLGVSGDKLPDGSDFNPSEVARKLDMVENAQRKVSAGQELTIEESQALSSVASPSVENLQVGTPSYLADRLSELNRDAKLIEREMGSYASAGDRVAYEEAESQLNAVRKELADTKLELDKLTSPSDYVKAESAESVMGKFDNLPERDRYRVKQVASAVGSQQEARLSRALTEQEKVDNIARAMEIEGLNSIYPKMADSSLMPSRMALNGSEVEARYPLVAKALSMVDPSTTRTGLIPVDRVLGLVQGIVARSGLGMDSGGYALQRGILEESFKLWDEVKGALPKAEGVGLRDFIKDSAKILQLSSRQANQVAKSLSEAFPELGVAFTYDRALPKGTVAMADSLTKLITTGIDSLQLNELIHELGHFNFYYGLNAEQRISWLDSLKKNVSTEEDWAKSFPSYNERLEALANITDEVEQVKQAFWMNNPAEMYAEQFSAFVMNNVIPRVETLQSFARVSKGLRKVFSASEKAFDNLPKDTKHFFLKVLASPEPSEIKVIGSEALQEQIESNWLFSPKEDAFIRAEEITSELDATYSGRTVGLEGMSAEEIDRMAAEAREGVSDTGVLTFEDIPVIERVGMYSMDDLPKVIELQALRLLYDMPRASFEELSLAMKRLDDILADKNRPDLVERLVSSRIQGQTKFDPNFDPAAGQYYSQSDLAWIKRQEDALEWGRLDPEARARVTYDEAQKSRRRYAEAAQEADAFILERSSEGRKRFSKEEREALIGRILRGESPSTSAEGRFRSEWDDTKEANNFNERWNAERSAVVNQLAAMDTQAEALRQFSTAIAAQKGLMDVIDPSFGQRLSYAEAFARIATDESSKIDPAIAFSTLARAGYCGVAGLEYDPEGVYIPFLGTVTWNPEKFFSSPLNVLMIPGVPTAAMKSGRLVTTKGAQRFKARFPELFKKASQPIKVLKRNFGPTMGFGSKANILSQSEVYAASKRQNFTEFAETMLRHFSHEDREKIAVIASKDVGWEDLTELALIEGREDIFSAVELTRRAYATVEEEFARLGVKSERFSELRGNYINRYYTAMDKKGTNGIFKSYNISPIRANFLKHRGITQALSGEPLDLLKEEATRSGVELKEGTKINAYRTETGQVIYTIPDTPFDRSVAGQNDKWHTWDQPSGGYVIEDARSGRTKLRRDFTMEERQDMGEQLDVAVRAAAMGERIEQDLRKAYIFNELSLSDSVIDPGKEFQAIKELGGGSYDAKTAVDYAKNNPTKWKLIPASIDESTGISKYGALSGKYVDIDTWELLQAAEGGAIDKIVKSKLFQSTAIGIALTAHKALLTGWKITRTVFSPVASMNNFTSNMFMGYLCGRNPVTDLYHGAKVVKVRQLDLAAKKAMKAGEYDKAQEYLTRMQNAPYYQYYVDIRNARMSDSSMWYSELRSDDIVDQIIAAAEDQTKTQQSRMFELIAVAAKGINKGAQTLYEMGDLIYKMGGFVADRMAGADSSGALNRVYEAYFDYRQLAPGIRFLRDSGLVPFVSYFYKALPAIGKSLVEHPDKYAKVALSLEALHITGIASVYGDEDLIAVRDALDEASPTYMQGKGLGGMFRTRVALPFGQQGTANGKDTLNVLDLSRMIPGGDMWETNSSGVNDIEYSLSGVGELCRSMLSQSPIMSLAVQAATGQNPAFGNAYQPPNVASQKNEQARQFIYTLWNSIAPNIPAIPYTYSQDAFGEALAGNGFIDEWHGKTGMDSLGIPKSLGAASLQQVGIKVRRFSPISTLAKKMQSDENEVLKGKAALGRIRRSPLYSESYKERATEGFKQDVVDFKERSAKRSEFLRLLRSHSQTIRGGQSLPH